MEEAKTRLTIYLIRPDQVGAFEEEHKKPGGDIRALVDLDGEFLPFPSAASEPPWVAVIRSALKDPTELALTGQSPAGLLVVRRQANTFVMSFGHAWQKLKEQWLEPDFGLRVALNAIAPNKLIEIRAEQVFALWHVASERAPRASFVDQFGVEFDRDLLASLEGIPSDKLFGDHIRGGTNLRLDLPFSKLPDILDQAATLFQSPAYKARWPEVGNVSPVKDSQLIEKLEAQLDTEFVSGQAQARLVLFTPAQRRDEESQLAHYYVFGRMLKNPSTAPYLMPGSWMGLLAEKGLKPSVETAKSSRIHLLDEAKEKIKDYSVFDCLCYELPFEGRAYILSSGVWYEVAADFQKRVNQGLAKIPQPNVALFPWDGIETEGKYNLGYAAGAFLHFDSADVIFGGGASRFEFCDFLHQESKTLFFAKIASKSSGMSHLVEQVRRTAELLFSSDQAYRKALKKVYKKYHPAVDVGWLDSRPRNGDWNLCMVSLGRAANKLPFFAKCALWRTYRDLTERGHVISFVAV
ncbi:MAG TPA: TIGR04141 family sporadically distributed protein [Terriglobia bacterium]|nr:TIGR04141 family sporadically distributed protein [Terriglobia bacterium]